MKGTLRALLLFIYSIGMMIYVFFCGYPSLIGSILMLVSFPVLFGAVNLL